MAKGSINKVILIGRLGQDPELKYTPQDVAVCTFSIATDEGYKTPSGEEVNRTEWHRIVIWRKLAEIAGQYLKKGSLVYIEGKLSTRSWEKEGQKHYTTEVVCLNMTMLGGKSSSSATMDTPSSPTSEVKKGTEQEEAPLSFSQPTQEIEEDDLPF